MPAIDEGGGSPQQPLLIAEGLGRRIDQGWLYRALRLSIFPGECLAITGPVGAGKSLLMRLLAGLDPLDEGDVILLGKPQGDWDMPSYRANVVYMHQSPAFFEGTVEENLALPFALRIHRHRSFPGERAVELTKKLGLDARFLSKNAYSLSGGEAQVAALVRAMLLDPRILLMDEATSAMDLPTVVRAESLIREWLQEEPGRACLWVTHDQGQCERVASRDIALTGERQ